MANQLVNRIRRNHGLEHATVHVLSERYTHFSAQGNSNHQGFRLNVYGDISEEQVADAVEEAYRRLKAGQHHLAVHPNCGTVLLTTATMATLAAQATFSLEQKRQRRSHVDGSVLLSALPSAILAVVVSLVVSRPIGVRLQAKYTTEGDLGNLQISRIRQVSPSLMTRLFQLLLTAGTSQLQARSYKIETSG